MHGRTRKSQEDLRQEGSSEAVELAKLNGRHAYPPDITEYGDNANDSGDDADRGLLEGEISPSFYPTRRVRDESTRKFVKGILIETVPTLFLTTLGLTLTGEMLERVAAWRALKRVNELYILIPMLNNLKGNLEMNLSSRLSTAANIGDLDVVTTRKSLILGNLSLLQVQALLVSAIAAVMSFGLSLVIRPTSEPAISARRSLSIYRRKPLPTPPAEASNSGLREFEILLSTAMTSASLSGMVLGSFMCSLILLCRRLRLNPDNITPPIASCLGDLITLCIIGLVSSLLIRLIKTVFPVVLLILLFIGTIFAVMATIRNEYVHSLLYMGWVPLLGAMVISSGTGMVLDSFVNRYEAYGLLSIVIGGLPGAVGSVFVSRLSTSLHAAAAHSYPSDKIYAGSRNILTTLTLFLVTLPVLFIFIGSIQLIGWTKLPLVFIFIFIPIFCLTVLISLTTARLLTQFLWSRGLDPDTYALPIQSSLVDLSGQLMLAACFEIASALGADVKNKSLS